MSRSNPEDSPHPCKRWLEWDGALGNLKYYDKENKTNIPVELPFAFVLLDRLHVVKGWHQGTQSGITSNEVKDIRSDILHVRSFKGGIMAEGYYADIKNQIKAEGGHYTLNLYIGFEGDDGVTIGSLQLKGGALSSWLEFEKANRGMMYKGMITVVDKAKHKNGNVVFYRPQWEMGESSETLNEQATDLDRELQKYLAQYFNRGKSGPVDEPARPAPPTVGDDDEIPF